MSFSGEIKEELAVQYAKARHCNLAELSAIFGMCGEFYEARNGTCALRFRTENFPVARKCFSLMIFPYCVLDRGACPYCFSICFFSSAIRGSRIEESHKI